MAGESQETPDPGVDATGRPVFDPSKNVLDLVEAAVERLDDLQNKDARHVREILRLRTERNDDLRVSESKHLRDMMALRANYDEKLRNKETQRIDAIRQVDVGAVAAAAAVQAAQANTLATTVATSAEAMRANVQAAATAQTIALKAETDPLRKDIADLRQVQYETAGGKQQVTETREAQVDMKPMLDAIAELSRGQDAARGQREQIVESRAKSGNTNLWIGLGAAIFFGFSTLMLGVFGVVITLLLRK